MFHHPNLCDLERENENLRELLKLGEILDGKDPGGEVYSFGNEQTEKIDFEKAKILKDLIDYRNRESLDGSNTEVKDHNLKTFNTPLKMNSSILSLDSGGLSNNCDFVCRAASDKDSLDELFEPICNSHI